MGQESDGGPDREFEPIAEGVFETWLKPSDALVAYGYSILSSLEPFIRELYFGRIRSASADIAWICGNAQGREAHGLIAKELWGVEPPNARSPLWFHGQYGVVLPRTLSGRNSELIIQMFDVRFEPPNAQKIAHDQTGDELPPIEKAKSSPSPNLPKADAEKFCLAIVAGWPEANQDWAWDKAKLFFPENEIPRDWFRSILRSKRPEKKRGRQPKNEN